MANTNIKCVLLTVYIRINTKVLKKNPIKSKA